jgi:hypothetical protein
MAAHPERTIGVSGPRTSRRVAATRGPVDGCATWAGPSARRHPTAKQQALLARRGRDGDTPADVLTEVYSVRGAFDFGAFVSAMDRVVSRHETLRTALGPDRSPEVVRDGPAVVSLAGVAGGLKRREWVDRRFATSLSPEEPPLLRVAVAADDDDATHLLAFSGHTIAFDGWSFGVVLAELAASYPMLSRGGELPAVDPLEPAQEAPVEAEVVEARAAPLVGAGRPPWSATPPAAAGPARRHVLQVDAPVVERLQRSARARGGSVFTALLAAVRLSLVELFAADDVVLGVCAANRVAANEAAVGAYANLLPLRGIVGVEDTPADVLDAEQERLFGLLDRTDVPSSAVLASAGLADDDVRVHVTLEPAHVPFAVPGLDLGYVYPRLRWMRPDISIVAAYEPGRLELMIDARLDTMGEVAPETLGKAVHRVLSRISEPGVE